MEASRKKPIMVAIIVACVVAAGVITYVTQSEGGSGIDTVKRGRMTWLKCANPDCEAEYEMDLKDYHKAAEKRWRPMAMGPPALTCKECGEESAYRVEKCPGCELLFPRGSVADAFVDKCPECGYSQIEEDRKKS